MALVWIHELNVAQGQLQLDAKGHIKRDYTRQYQVKSDSLAESPLTVLLNTAQDGNTLPQLGSIYQVGTATDLVARVTDTQAQRTADAYLWEVTVKYTILDVGDGDKPNDPDPNDATDPRNWMPQITTSFVKRSRPCSFDIFQNPIVNSCNVPFDPPPMVDDDVVQYHITRYEGIPNWQQIADYQNTLNLKPFWGRPAGMLKLLPITVELERIDNFNYWKKSYTIEEAPGWNLPDGSIMDWGFKPLDRGFTRLVDQNGNPITSVTPPTSMKQLAITDFNGRGHQTPQLLDGHGSPLPPGATPVWVAFGVAAPPPRGNRLSRVNGNLVDGYQLTTAADFNNLNLPDITVFDRWF